MKKNILFCTTAEKMFGSEMSLYHLSMELKEKYNIYVIFPERNEVERYFNQGGINTVVLNVKKMGFWDRIARIKKIINQNTIQVVFINYHQDLSTFFWPLKFSKIPIVVYLRMTGGFTIKELILFNFVEKIVCVSDCVRRNLLKARRVKGFVRYFKKREEVVYNGRNLSKVFWAGNRNKFRNEVSLQEEQFAIGIVGAIAPRKRQDLFVRVAKELSSAHDYLKFFIVGGLYGKRHERYKIQVEELIQEYGLDNHVKMLGERQDIPDVMAGLDLTLALSDQEAFGGVVVESLACRTPVVARAIEGYKELVQDGIDGVLVKTSDPVFIAKKVEDFIANNKQYERTRQLAREGSKRFDIHKTTESISRIIEENTRII